MGTSPPSVQTIHLKGSLIGNIKARLRLLAGCNVVTWRCYLRLSGKPLPDPKHIDVIVEGYPRSGNTYAVHMLRIMCPGLRWISHTHSGGTLLWAQKHGIPSLILMREPQEAAVSLYIYQMQNIGLHLCFREWEAFYRNALQRDAVSFVSFDSLTSNTEASLCSALSNIGLASSIKNNLPPNPRSTFRASHDHDKRHLRKVRGVNYGEEQANRPSEKRDIVKKQILLNIQRSKNPFLIQQIAQCSQLFLYLSTTH